MEYAAGDWDDLPPDGAQEQCGAVSRDRAALHHFKLAGTQLTGFTSTKVQIPTQKCYAQAEFERWAPSVTAIVYRGNPAERKVLFNEHMKDGKFNVLIVQFELVMDKQDAKRLKVLSLLALLVQKYRH